jgi:hypothetical protein
MDNETKIHLSDFEMNLLTNTEWILTKNNIIKKAQRLLVGVQQNIVDYTKLHPDLFPAEVAAVSPKIARGENYEGLPWLMLDFPRYFNKENLFAGQTDIFAIRTMFWWGNFFSTTLHLSGKYKQVYADALAACYPQLCTDDFHICINEGQWHHHFEKDNFLPVKNITPEKFAELIREKDFIKVSSKFSLTDWKNAINLLTGNFIRIVNWLA